MPSLPPSSKRIDLGANQIDIHFRATRLGALSDVAATSPPSAADNETQTLSVPGRLRRCGREIKMIDETNPFAAAKPDRRLIKLLIQARRFNTALVGSDGTPFAALAKREGVSPSYFTRLLSFRFCPLKKRISAPRGRHIDEMRLELCDVLRTQHHVEVEVIEHRRNGDFQVFRSF